MTTSTLDSYLSTWRAGDPQRSLAWRFLRPGERIRFGACAALVGEWRKAVREVTEPQVTATKLGWWRDELQRAGAGQASHPLTQSLFSDPAVRDLPLSLWTRVVDAAWSGVASPPAADFAEQRRAAEPLAAAVAALETGVWFGPGDEPARASAVTLVAMLVTDLRAIASEALRGKPALPMNLMARHGLTVEGLTVDGPKRRAAVHDFAGMLGDALVVAGTQPGPLTLFREVGYGHDAHGLAKAARAMDPVLALHAHAVGLGNLLKTWRAARTWREISSSKADP